MAEIEFPGKFLDKIDKIDRGTLLTYIHGITAEKDFFQGILDSFAAGVLVLDDAGKVRFLSRGAKSMLGISHSLPRRAKPALEEVVKDEELQAFLTKHLHLGSHVSQQELEILLPQHLYLSISISPFDNPVVPLKGCIVLLVNITFSRERDRKIHQMQKIDTLARLAGGIAHEIGNPLNSIGIHLKLLERELAAADPSVSRKCGEYLDVLQVETRRLDRMVRSFLKVTRRKSSPFKLEDVNQVLDASVSLMLPEIKESGVRIELKRAKNLPPFLMDGEKMKQVFINLIKNAIQSMPKGGLLQISAEMRDKICALTFKDQGGGIPEDHLPHIFDAYYTTKTEGAGLGLMIVSGIVQEHGGRIEVKSTVGKGTVFKIFLPIHREKLQLPEKSEKAADT